MHHYITGTSHLEALHWNIELDSTLCAYGVTQAVNNVVIGRVVDELLVTLHQFSDEFAGFVSLFKDTVDIIDMVDTYFSDIEKLNIVELLLSVQFQVIYMEPEQHYPEIYAFFNASSFEVIISSSISISDKILINTTSRTSD